MPARRRAFTLVELLVVIGIITVLVSILFPVLSRVRQHARAVQCAANLHAIGHALTLYTQQYSYYPGMAGADVGLPDAAVWPVRLRAFLGGSKEVFYCPAQDERSRWSEDGPAPVVPAGGAFVLYGYEPGEPLLHSGAGFSYGYNGGGVSGTTGLGLRVGKSIPAGYGPVKASRVRQPADMIAVTDSTCDAIQDYATVAAVTATSMWPGMVHPAAAHGGGANVLFCDGHVSWYPQKDLLVDASHFNPEDAAKERMWNSDHRWHYDGLGLP
jgi:prepilin-type processing-associated H-X9-DG protein/prepilin-type N-terminal cleavage/methylation domain-containing protein